MFKQEFLLIGGMAIATLLIRYPPLAMSSRIKLSPQLTQALNYLPPAIFTAIVVPSVLMPAGNEIFLSYTNARLVGAIATITVCWRTKNLLATIVFGMLFFSIYQWFLVVLQNYD